MEALHRRGKRAEHVREAILGSVMAAPSVAPDPSKATEAMELASPRNGPPPTTDSAPAEELSEAVQSDSGGDGAVDNSAFVECVPLRLAPEERGLLKIVESALEVSEYTDSVDTVRSYGKDRRMMEGLREMYSMITGLAVSARPGRAGERLVVDRFSENEDLFRRAFEVARRYKVMNPEKLRGTYGKLMYLLQDASQPRFVEHVGIHPVKELETVRSFLLKRGKRALALLEDPQLRDATREVVNDGTKTPAYLAREVQRKRVAQEELKQKYKTKENEEAETVGPVQPLTEADIQRVLDSVGDADNYVTYNVKPVLRMLELLEENFHPDKEEKQYSLSLRGGSYFNKYGSSGSYSSAYSSARYSSLGGSAKLTHDHATQFAFVKQSLTLWAKMMESMYRLWYAADRDLLSQKDDYSLWNTGQGLNRVQRCPNVRAEMRRILAEVQRRCGPWVGLSVVHLGDRDVPNALMFIDKYTQIPRILAPIVRAVDSIEELMASHDAIKVYVTENWGDGRGLRMQILSDFFRYAFDGDGDDGGSCIDGRLTSTWNWCSRIEKKKYNHFFMLAGFQGFDGDFKG